MRGLVVFSGGGKRSLRCRVNNIIKVIVIINAIKVSGRHTTSPFEKRNELASFVVEN